MKILITSAGAIGLMVGLMGLPRPESGFGKLEEGGNWRYAIRIDSLSDDYLTSNRRGEDGIPRAVESIESTEMKRIIP